MGKSILAKHAEVRGGGGPLKPDRTQAAIAELQEQLAKKDPSFKPKHDMRKAP